VRGKLGWRRRATFHAGEKDVWELYSIKKCIYARKRLSTVNLRGNVQKLKASMCAEIKILNILCILGVAALRAARWTSRGICLIHIKVTWITNHRPSFTLSMFNAYVALSRSRGRDTIRLLRPFERKLFTKHLSKHLQLEDMGLRDMTEQWYRTFWEI
jgi:hypothetical protein